MIWMHSSVAPRLGVTLLLTAAFMRAGPTPPAPLDRRAVRGWRNRVSAVGRRGKRELAMAPPWTGRDPRAVVPILRLGTGAQHLRRRFSAARRPLDHLGRHRHYRGGPVSARAWS